MSKLLVCIVSSVLVKGLMLFCKGEDARELSTMPRQVEIKNCGTKRKIVASFTVRRITLRKEFLAPIVQES
jgi:hypothetical protein